MPSLALPELIFAAFFVAGSLVAAAYIAWRLRLKWWWIAFPPMTMGVVSGNPGVIVLALLVSWRPFPQALAGILKVYGAVPLVIERRWKALGVLALLFVASVVVAPRLWLDYVGAADAISERLSVQADGGAGASTWGIPGMALGQSCSPSLRGTTFELPVGWPSPCCGRPGSGTTR